MEKSKKIKKENNKDIKHKLQVFNILNYFAGFK